MASVKNLSDQLVSAWQGSTPAARVGLILLTLLCTGIVGGVGYWSMQPYYVTLASDLDPAAMSGLVAELDRSNIQYEIRGAGSSLAVDKREYSRAQMLAKSKGVSTSTSTAVESLSPLDPPLNLEAMERRNLENKLSDSIRRYDYVEDAVVLLSLPKPQAFVRNQEKPSASVVLSIRKSNRLSDSQAATIAQFVAGSITGMTPQQVTITDSSGNNFTMPEGHMTGLGQQEEMRFMREQELISRARSMLAKLSDFEDFVVQITADFTFPDAETTSITYDPKNKVLLTEEISSTLNSVPDPLMTGGAGVVSNLSSQGSPGSATKLVTSKTDDTTSKYEVSKTSLVQRERTPKLNLMTVSVIGNTSALKDASGQVPADMKDKIGKIVKSAIGFVDDRDIINVEFLPFAELDVVESTPVNTIPWDQITEILRNASLAVGAVVAFVVAWLLLGRIKPSPLDASPASSGAGSARLEQLGKLVEQNPEVFSRIVAAWATSTAGSTEADDSKGTESKEAA